MSILRNALVCAMQFPEKRLKARRCEVQTCLDDAYPPVANFTWDGWAIACHHGGSVCNSYGYAAETECVLAISDPQLNVVYWCGRVRANKVTLSGVASALLPAAVPIFDGRVKSSIKIGDAWNCIRQVHRDMLREAVASLKPEEAPRTIPPPIEHRRHLRYIAVDGTEPGT